MVKVQQKIFVLDTSAIMALVMDVTTINDLTAPSFAGVLGDNEIVIPRVVLDELDGLKKAGGERGKAAIDAARQIEKYSYEGSLVEGIETEKGGTLRIAARPAADKLLALDLKVGVADHEIIATAIEIEDSLGKGTPSKYTEEDEPPHVILISQDRILRVLARSMYQLAAEELKSVCTPTSENDTGVLKIEVDSDTIDQIIDKGYYDAPFRATVNEFFHIVDKENPSVHYCYGMVREQGGSRIEILDRTKLDYLKVAGEVMAKNVRQKFLLWALMGCGESDPMAEDGIRLITISGPAGSGKSFLTLAAAWERLERGHFDRIVVTRAMVDVGTSMGFLPGTLEEKLRPWGGPIEDNLRAIVQVPSPDEGRGGSGSKRGMQRAAKPFDAKTWLEMEDRLELVPLTYIRGRTFRKSIVILEEAQNIERGPLKVLLTRLGEGSIIIILGDSSQIDNQFLSRRNNGLVHAKNAFRGWPQAVHVQLKSIVRSDLAEAAAKRL